MPKLLLPLSNFSKPKGMLSWIEDLLKNKKLWVRWALLCCLCCGAIGLFTPLSAQQQPTSLTQDTKDNASGPIAIPGLKGTPTEWTEPERLSSTLQVMLLLTVVSLAPAILLMTTSFVRVIVVLGLVRQALGTQQLPPAQVITGLSLFITLVVMTPVWTDVYNNSIKPYTEQTPEKPVTLDQAWTAGIKPIRKFMGDQLARTGNDDDVYLFLKYMPKDTNPKTGKSYKYLYYGEKEGYKEVPLQALLPAFMLSELKTAFLIGFQIFLPFLILDIVVSSVTISMGMLMLPPVLISLPFKILLFVLLDGWHLIVEMLMASFQPYS